MIFLDTSKYPLQLQYERGWSLPPLPSGAAIRCKERDYFRLQYKNSELFIKPYPRQITISGDLKDMALGFAMMVQETLQFMRTGIGSEEDRDIFDEAFIFSGDGLINGCWITDSIKITKVFIEIYNRVYPTVSLLKE